VVIDVYDILQSKEDKATVPIYYEGSVPAPGAVNRALAVHRSV
jgi:type I site-specific restriction-modification system R (restriction) subunit